MNKVLSLLLLTSMFISISIAASDKKSSGKYENVLIKNTELSCLFSEAISDSFYIYIKLPKGYKESNKSYPVLYLLDGDISFPMASSIVRYQQYGKKVPEMIIAGIGYGTMLSDDEINYRTRDYNLPGLKWHEQEGGSDKFLKFLKNKLIPFVEKQYRAETKGRIISGYSLSGQFVLYTFLNHPKLFDKYIAGSPYLSQSIKQLLNLEKKSTDKLSDAEARIFISYGENEPAELYRNLITEFADRIKSRNYRGVKIKKKVFEGGSHFVCPPEAMSYGLDFVFDN